MKLPTFSEIKKTLAALSAAVVVAVGAGLLTGQLAVWITGAVAAIGAAIATYAAPANGPSLRGVTDTGPGSTLELTGPGVLAPSAAPAAAPVIAPPTAEPTGV